MGVSVPTTLCIGDVGGARSGDFDLSDTPFEAPGPVWGVVAGDVDDDGAMDVVVLSAPAGMAGRVDVYTADP